MMTLVDIDLFYSKSVLVLWAFEWIKGCKKVHFLLLIKEQSRGEFQRSLVSCMSTFSKDFSSKITGPILFKFHSQPSGKGGKKI